MITADQVLCHMIGDYILQSDWQANEKTKAWYPAFSHALIYTSCFLVLRPSFPAYLVMITSHYFIDRYRLARYLVWLKNWLAPVRNAPWSECMGTGYPSVRPAWMSVWLMIIADNITHILINGAALKWL